MQKLDRIGLADSLKKALEELRKESQGLLAKIPSLKNNFKDAEDILEGFVKDLQELPRICIVGSTGMGKSTLINHILDVAVAETGAIFSTTKHAKPYFYPSDNPICEIVDTRGLNEVFQKENAEIQLIEELTEKRPHLIIFVVDAVGRAGVDRELVFLKQLLNDCSNKFHREIGCLILANRCDGITPSGFANLPEGNWRLATEHDTPRTSQKRSNIIEKLKLIEQTIANTGFRHKPNVLPSALSWHPEKRFWNREHVMKEVFEQSPMNLLFALGQLDQASSNLNKSLEEIAQQIVNKFTIVSATACINPFPTPDAALLLPIQTAMIRAVGAIGLTGELSTLDIMKILGLVSYTGKAIANWLLKLVPAGQLINATVAATITYTLGQIAIKHYIYGWGLEELTSIADLSHFKDEVGQLLSKDKQE